MNKDNNNVTITETSSKNYITYDFKDVKNVRIPSKIKCSKCGREVAGYHKLIWERVMNDFNGEWLRYQKEWKCGDCKREEKKELISKLDAVKKEQKIAEAIKLLESEGYKVKKANNEKVLKLKAE